MVPPMKSRMLGVLVAGGIAAGQLMAEAPAPPAAMPDVEEAIPGPVTHVWLPGGHDPRNADGAISDAVNDWLGALT